MSSVNLNYEKEDVKGKVINIILWGLQLLTAGMFFMASFMKLSGAEMMIKEFDLIGIGQWFRYLTGTIEGFSAILLLIPSFSGIGALLLIPTMIGAIAAHFVILGGSATPAFVLLVFSILIAFGRKDSILYFVNKFISKK